MLIGYLFDNNYWDLKKILYFYFCPQMLPSVRTFYCPNISGQKYLPWLSGPETKNLSFPLSFLYSLQSPRTLVGSNPRRGNNFFFTFFHVLEHPVMSKSSFSIHKIINKYLGTYLLSLRNLEAQKREQKEK